MAVTRTTSTLRSDCDDGRGSRRCNPRTRTRAADGRRTSKGSVGVESGSVAAKRGGSGKFLLVGAVLAIQFVGAAAISSKGECFLFFLNDFCFVRKDIHKSRKSLGLQRCVCECVCICARVYFLSRNSTGRMGLEGNSDMIDK